MLVLVNQHALHSEGFSRWKVCSCWCWWQVAGERWHVTGDILRDLVSPVCRKRKGEIWGEEMGLCYTTTCIENWVRVEINPSRFIFLWPLKPLLPCPTCTALGAGVMRMRQRGNDGIRIIGTERVTVYWCDGSGRWSSEVGKRPGHVTEGELGGRLGELR